MYTNIPSYWNWTCFYFAFFFVNNEKNFYYCILDLNTINYNTQNDPIYLDNITIRMLDKHDMVQQRYKYAGGIIILSGFFFR